MARLRDLIEALAVQKLKTVFLILSLLLSVGSTSLDDPTNRDGGCTMKYISLVFLMVVFGVGLTWLDANAATDDAAFNQCEQMLNNDKDVLPGIIWHSGPLPQAILRVETPTLFGSKIIRWKALRNSTGMMTFAILSRDREDSLTADDPDGIDIISDRAGKVSFKQMIGANSFAFTKYKNIGVNGLVFCTQEEIGKLWTWSGDNWDVR